MKQQQVAYQDTGIISYQEAWDLQTKLQQELIKAKRAGEEIHHYLLFCEHHPVYTLGKSGSTEHLLIDTESSEEFEFFKINRGGDITYHGPGQLTVYPIFDLDRFFTDVHKYVRYLEEAVIKTLAHFGISGKRIDGFTGVWIDVPEGIQNRKICAIGVHLSRWVTLHGLALNVSPDLSHFDNIIPCGIQDNDKTVTSMAAELGHEVDLGEVKIILLKEFSLLFDYQYTK